MKKLTWKSLPGWISIIVLLASPPGVFAKDMQGRLGLGYNAQFANQQTLIPNAVPAVSLKYGLTRDIAAEGIAGVATSTPGNSVAAVKLFKNLFYEQNLNFYFLAGGGIVNGASCSGIGCTPESHTGAQFLGGFGAEFFIPGIESLGFSMESGGTLDNLSGSFVLKTMGVSFLNAGMHFYF